MTEQERALLEARRREEEERKRKAQIARSQAVQMPLGTNMPMQAGPMGGGQSMLAQMGNQLKQQAMSAILGPIGSLFGLNSGGKVPAVSCPHCKQMNCNNGCKVGYSEGGQVQMPLAQRKQINDERRKEEMHKLALRHKEEQHQLSMKMKARPPLAKGD